MVIQIKEKPRKPDDFDGIKTASELYGERKKRIQKSEKVTAPAHWHKSKTTKTTEQ